MIDIRRAADHDFEGIWEIFRQVVREGETYAIARDTDREGAREIWIENPTATYVAVKNDQIAGTYYIKTNQSGPGAHVCNAGYMVKADARGHGVGRAMCEHSLLEARRLGYQAMQYNLVVGTNESAIKLWIELGFAIIGTIPKAFNHPRLGLVDAHIMHRFLGDAT